MSLQEQLREYERYWASGAVRYAGFDIGFEKKTVERMRELLEESPQCFTRERLAGHFTGSALVVSQDLLEVLLTHHGKLDMWIQLGGHADGDPDLAEVALREASEESGLEDLELLPYEAHLGAETLLPFDLDVHTIPARGDVPEHLHYDVRFLVYTSHPRAIKANHESHELRWLSLEDARGLTEEPSMRRQFAKLEAVRELLKGTSAIAGSCGSGIDQGA